MSGRRRKNESQFLSKNYPNLYRLPDSPCFIFRKYSSAKKKEFYHSTGETKNEAKAYRAGLEAYNNWIGKVQDDAGIVYFGRLGKRYLNLKLEDKSLAKRTREGFKNQMEASSRSSGRKDEVFRPRLLDAFGHLPLKSVTTEVWKTWTNEVLVDHPEFKFFNARKALLEVLHYAVENRYLDRVPKLDLPDGDPAPPREYSDEEMRKLFNAAHYVELVRGPGGTTVPRMKPGGVAPYRVKNWIKLLMLICRKQGPRPSEAMQYEWPMLHFDEGATVRKLKPGEEPIPGEPRIGTIHIPGKITKTRRGRVIDLNPMVSRTLKFLQPSASSKFIFPSPDHPDRAMGSYHKTWAGLCRRAEFDAEMYWFRDTFITRKIRASVPLPFLAKYLDTSVAMLERRYAVPSGADFRRVAE